MVDYLTLITPMIIVSAYLAVGIGGIFLSKRAGHTTIVDDELDDK